MKEGVPSPSEEFDPVAHKYNLEARKYSVPPSEIERDRKKLKEQGLSEAQIEAEIQHKQKRMEEATERAAEVRRDREVEKARALLEKDFREAA